MKKIILSILIVLFAVSAKSQLINSSINTSNSQAKLTQEICIVSVDTAINKNIILWDKPISNMIDFFKIYKETLVAGIYDSIGVKPYDSLSYFIDTASQPWFRSERYKISVVDSSGNEGSLSNFHETMHLSICQGLGSSINLIWNAYLGFQFNTYRIFAGSSISGLVLIDSVSPSSLSYTVLNPPLGINYYMIEVVPYMPCNASKVNTSYNSSRSNVNPPTPPDTTGILNSNRNDIDFKIYPNPNSGSFIIDIRTLKKDEVDIKVLNLLGSCVYEENNINLRNSYKTNVNLEGLNSGVYFAIIQNKESRTAKRVIIQK